MIAAPLFLIAASLVQSPLETAVDAIVSQEMKAKKIQGLNLLVTQDDKVILRKAYGLADVEQDIPLTTEYVGETGSIGKSFTATVILQLVEEGKLSLSDTLEKRLKDCPDAWKAITLRQLLNQVTGIPDYALIPGLGLVEQWTYDQWLKTMGGTKFDFPTGQIWAYSNSNYLILGKVAEQVTGESYTQLVQKRIFDTLGMKRSFPCEQTLIIPKRMRGYLNLGARIGNGLFISPGYGDGSWINSCEDLATYEKGIREGQLLKPETVREMQSAGKSPSGRNLPYGMGWFVKKVNGMPIISHGGNTGGFMASLTRVPDGKLTVVLIGSIHDQAGDPIAQRIAEVYVPGLNPKKMSVQADSNPDLTARLLATLKNLAERKLEGLDLDPEMTARLATARGRAALGGLAKFAKVEKLEFLESSADEPDVVYHYRTEVGGKSYVLSFTVSKDKKIFSIGQREES